MVGIVAPVSGGVPRASGDKPHGWPFEIPVALCSPRQRG
ncbi:hypothetical protein AC98_3237 [Escherichia coli 2-210-07_S4_C2]|nr:hypothetical protein AD26_3003 [Escherichia coli 2-156-04_S4_C3]KDX59593.1 hypothetical protein AC98_3237 [Escherichia coli 2-210-07_S4_C2]